MENQISRTERKAIDTFLTSKNVDVVDVFSSSQLSLNSATSKDTVHMLKMGAIALAAFAWTCYQLDTSSLTSTCLNLTFAGIAAYEATSILKSGILETATSSDCSNFLKNSTLSQNVLRSIDDIQIKAIFKRAALYAACGAGLVFSQMSSSV